MDPLLNRRTLPVQLTVLFVVPPETQWESICRTLKNIIPDISSKLYLLSLVDKNDQEKRLTTRRKLETLTKSCLDDFHHHILQRSGADIEVILKTAVHHACDLILITCNDSACFTVNNKIIKLKTLVKRSPVPILAIPETHITGKDADRNQNNFSRTLIHINFQESNRLCSAFALRCARLLECKSILTSSGKPMEEVEQTKYLEFIRDRYWDPANTSLMLLPQTARTPGSNLLESISETSPDLVMLALNYNSMMKRSSLIDSIKPIIQDHALPVLIIQRRDWMKDVEKKLLSVYHSFSEFDLSRIDNTDPGSLTFNINDKASEKLMLGFYSRQGIMDALDRYGLLKSLKRRGYPSIEINIGSLNHSMERLQVHDRSQSPDEPLIDMVFRQEVIPNIDNLPENFPSNSGPFLYIEWLCIQDPMRSYRELEIPLPGQRYPGLGIGWKVLLIIKMMARRIGAAAVYNRPEYYHTARLYHRYFRYLDPWLEGRLLALDRDTFPRHLVETSWAFLHNLVREKNEPCQWTGGPQILPLHPDVKAYFQTNSYSNQVHASLNSQRFSLDLDKMRDMIKDRSLYRQPGDYRRFF